MSKFEDECKNVNDKNLKLICDYLLGRQDMQEKLNNPNKSIDKMFDYVRSKAKEKPSMNVRLSLMWKYSDGQCITTMKKMLVVMKSSLHV